MHLSHLHHVFGGSIGLRSIDMLIDPAYGDLSIPAEDSPSQQKGSSLLRSSNHLINAPLAAAAPAKEKFSAADRSSRNARDMSITSSTSTSRTEIQQSTDSDPNSSHAVTRPTADYIRLGSSAVDDHENPSTAIIPTEPRTADNEIEQLEARQQANRERQERTRLRQLEELYEEDSMIQRRLQALKQ